MKLSNRLFYTSLLIVAVVFAIYASLWHCDFILLDDDTHIYDNPHVRTGLTWSNVQWAFTSFHASQWIPLSWISHMTDVALFGLDPGAHHMMAVAIHVLNSCLLLFALYRLTGAYWESAAVAILFAVHPMNVESVAWAAERKNLLSTFFWILALILYVRHARSPRAATMAAVFGCMAVGMLCKGMLVTLPCALLLLDYWPLERWRVQSWRSLVVEKIPLFLISIAGSVVTSQAAASGGALVSTEASPILNRICNALANYGIYIGKLIWPENLSILYPVPREPLVYEAFLAGGGIALVLWMGWLLRTRGPYLLMGFLWFLGVLFPVSGVVQLGKSVMTDRFTYVPQIGFFIAIVWSISALARWKSISPRLIGAICAIIIVCLSLRSAAYVMHWKSSVAIFSEAVAVTERNAIAHEYAGFALARAGAMDEALKHYKRALEIEPANADARTTYATTLAKMGRDQEAIAQLRRAIKDAPFYPRAYLNLATHLLKLNQAGEAITILEGLKENGEEPFWVNYWLGRAWIASGDREKAREYFRKALTISPDSERAREALVKLEHGASEEAAAHQNH